MCRYYLSELVFICSSGTLFEQIMNITKISKEKYFITLETKEVKKCLIHLIIFIFHLMHAANNANNSKSFVLCVF